MKRVEIRLLGSDDVVKEPIVIEAENAGYSIKACGSEAYVSAWKKVGDHEETVVVPLASVEYLQFQLHE